MRIGIIGAGIGGLSAAVGLHADGHDVSVFEQRSRHSPEGGTGLTLAANAFRALDAMGAGDVVRAVSSGDIASMRSGQRHPSGGWMLTLPAEAMAAMRTIHRGELSRALTENLPDHALHTGTPAQVAADGSPRITAGGLAQEFDLVVSADGIRSPNRRSLGLDGSLRYAGYTVWRGVTSGNVDLKGEAGETWGQGQIFGLVPLPDGRVYWFGTLTTAPGANVPDEHAAATRLFASWHDPIGACIAATSPDAVLRHDVYDLNTPLESFVRGKTVLLGDAAHAMTPNLGQGAGQAIEDAATLVLLLRSNRTEVLPAALERYNTIRRRRTATVMRTSRSVSHLAQLSRPLSAGLRNAFLRLTPGRLMEVMARRAHAWTAPVATD